MNSDDNKQRELDLKIAKAMQIDVPPLVMPELPDVDQEAVTALPEQKRSRMPIWFALAATVVLATSIALRTSDLFVTYGTLEEEVLAHLDHEPDALRVTDVVVSDESLLTAIPRELAVYRPGATLVTFAAPCVIRGRNTPHLVIQGQTGPVTILLLPEEPIAEVITLDGENVHGLIVPSGDGSIAIIGSREEALEPIRDELLESLTWTT